MQNTTIPTPCQHLPHWLPDPVRHYLDHTASGLPLRELARRNGIAASTVLRQVRQCETRRDDPLVDAALDSLRRVAQLAQDGSSAIVRMP